MYRRYCVTSRRRYTISFYWTLSAAGAECVRLGKMEAQLFHWIGGKWVEQTPPVDWRS